MRVLDKEFCPYLSADEIALAVGSVASAMAADLKNMRDEQGRGPLLLPILNGSFVFAADLCRELGAKGVEAEVCFVKNSSYSGTESTGCVKQLIGFPASIEGRDVVIVEDIIETGVSVKHNIEQLRSMGVRSIHICCLFHKPELFQCDYAIDYVGKVIDNDFIVGYGLDYKEHGRMLKDVWILDV